jgi:hypothetical protein
MTSLRFFFPLFVLAGLGALAPLDRAQAPAGAGASSSFAESSPAVTANHPALDLTYKRPTEKAKLRDYLLQAYGPVPMLGSAIIAAGNQYQNTPPEWGQGSGAYFQRFGSNFGTEVVTTTTHYALAEAFGEDTAYYRCTCNDFFQRFKHAMISTVTARHGEDGHYRFSLSGVAASYAGNFAAVYGWYPSRYGGTDALRMGSYDVLATAGENLFLEFIYGGPRTVFGRFRRSGSSSAGPAIASDH